MLCFPSIIHHHFPFLYLEHIFSPPFRLTGRPWAVLHGPAAAAGPGNGTDGAEPVAVSHLHPSGGHAKGPAAVHRGHQAKYVRRNFFLFFLFAFLKQNSVLSCLCPKFWSLLIRHHTVSHPRLESMAKIILCLPDVYLCYFPHSAPLPHPWHPPGWSEKDAEPLKIQIRDMETRIEKEKIRGAKLKQKVQFLSSLNTEDQVGQH